MKKIFIKIKKIYIEFKWLINLFFIILAAFLGLFGVNWILKNNKVDKMIEKKKKEHQEKLKEIEREEQELEKKILNKKADRESVANDHDNTLGI